MRRNQSGARWPPALFVLFGLWSAGCRERAAPRPVVLVSIDTLRAEPALVLRLGMRGRRGA